MRPALWGYSVVRESRVSNDYLHDSAQGFKFLSVLGVISVWLKHSLSHLWVGISALIFYGCLFSWFLHSWFLPFRCTVKERSILYSGAEAVTAVRFTILNSGVFPQSLKAAWSHYIQNASEPVGSASQVWCWVATTETLLVLLLG